MILVNSDSNLGLYKGDIDFHQQYLIFEGEIGNRGREALKLKIENELKMKTEGSCK